tara:strand:+ start:4685 stop:5221 length:537 start_codon:yes stop_codon:yes gene_type:complete
MFESHATRLWTVAASITGDRVEAEDVLQEAAVVALEKLDTFQPGTDFGAWMGRIVRYSALNRLRKRVRRWEVARGDEVLASRPAASPAPRAGITLQGELSPWDDGSWDDELVAALMDLRPTARACLLLKVVLELDHKTIAATLGIPEGTAMSHVHRARTAMLKSLSPESPTASGDHPR